MIQYFEMKTLRRLALGLLVWLVVGGGTVEAQGGGETAPFKALDFSRLKVDSFAVFSGIDLYHWGDREVIRSQEMHANDAGKPFACVASQEIPVVVQFRSWEKDSILAVWAEGTYGSLAPRLVRFQRVEGVDGMVGRDTFWFKPPPAVDLEDLEWRWRANGWTPFDTTRTRMHVVLQKPISPNHIPYVELLNLTCDWARGAMDNASAAQRITEGLKGLRGTTGNISYNAVFDEIVELPNVRGTGSFFSIEKVPNGQSLLHFSLDYFFLALHAPDVNVKVICYDMAGLLNLSLRSLGINDAEIATIGNWEWPYEPTEPDQACKWFKSQPLHPIGNYLNYNNFPHPREHFSEAPNLLFVQAEFSSHCFILLNGRVFDGTFDLLPNEPNMALLQYGRITEDEYIKSFVAIAPTEHKPPFCDASNIPRSSMQQGGIELLRFPGGGYPQLVSVDSIPFMLDLLGVKNSGLKVETFPRTHPMAVVHTFYQEVGGKPRRVGSLTFGGSGDTTYHPPTSTVHYFGQWERKGIVQRAGGLHRSGQVGDVGFDVYGDENTDNPYVDLGFWQAAAQRGNKLQRDTLSRQALEYNAGKMLPNTVRMGKLAPVSLPKNWQQQYFLNFYSSGGSFFLLEDQVYFNPEVAGRHEVECNVMTSTWVGKMKKAIQVVRR